MAYSAAEIETIVRRVLAELANSAAPNDLPSSTPRSAPIPPSEGRIGLSKESQPKDSEASFEIDGKVISVDRLKSIPKNVTRICFARNAIVTPAARDWIRERGLSIATMESKLGLVDGATPTPSIHVGGTAPWLPQLKRLVCPKQGAVSARSSDDASALREVQTHIRLGRKVALLCVEFAHAICWQAARDDALRPAVVRDWRELNDILVQVPANVIILDHRQWNAPAASNAVRRLFESLAMASRS